MTSYSQSPERSRDMQDMAERHIYSELEHVPGAGSVVKIRGTGSEDQEVPVMHTGYGMNLTKGSDAEVLVIGGGSDTNLKMAFVNLPADKQRAWKEGRGGIQHPMDPDVALEFKDGSLHLTKGELSVGEGGFLQVKDGQIYIRGNVTVTGKLTANEGIVTPNVYPGRDDKVPDFDPS